MSRGTWVLLLVFNVSLSCSIHGQIDPEKRRLIQAGYNQHLEGRGPIAGYGFYYHNDPDFTSTNMALRLAVAPIYLDSELGFKRLLGPNTDVGLGLAGGGFAETYSEVRRGAYRRQESFTGHGGELSSSIYHLVNPGDVLPLWIIARGAAEYDLYERDSETADDFELPRDRSAFHFRYGLRLGGQEPSLTAPLAFEVSLWHEARFRTHTEPYGFNDDRNVEPVTQLFWARALIKYTFPESQQAVEARLTTGTSSNADRFSAYRLGGVLPFASEFPLDIPGYYFQEISAQNFALLNAKYSVPLNPGKNWFAIVHGAAGNVDYLQGLEQAGDWHSGAGLGLTYVSPARSWLVSLFYGYGFNAIRDGGRGAQSVGLLLQYDFEARHRKDAHWFEPEVSPYKSRGGERILFR